MIELQRIVNTPQKQMLIMELVWLMARVKAVPSTSGLKEELYEDIKSILNHVNNLFGGSGTTCRAAISIEGKFSKVFQSINLLKAAGVLRRDQTVSLTVRFIKLAEGTRSIMYYQ